MSNNIFSILTLLVRSPYLMLIFGLSNILSILSVFMIDDRLIVPYIIVFLQ